jgi:iron-sulfur cluster assembly accessory protein
MAAMASSAYLAEMVEGKSLDEVSSITNQDVAQYLGLPAVKVHCSCLVAEVLQAAIADYKSKQSRVAIKRNVETRRALCAVTERAADYLKGHGRSDFALTTKTQGCMGTGYAMEFATPEVMDFECVSMHGINIYIRPESELFLAGVTIDYEVGDDKDGLVFNNPNETRKCKCGEAFYMD